MIPRRRNRQRGGVVQGQRDSEAGEPVHVLAEVAAAIVRVRRSAIAPIGIGRFVFR